jgi:cold shock CspA family protein
VSAEDLKYRGEEPKYRPAGLAWCPTCQRTRPTWIGLDDASGDQVRACSFCQRILERRIPMAPKGNGGGNSSAMKGTVRRLVRDDLGKLKGFGFIKATDGRDYFFHRSALQDVRLEEIAEGESVEFLPGKPNEKGERAEQVWLS